METAHFTSISLCSGNLWFAPFVMPAIMAATVQTVLARRIAALSQRWVWPAFIFLERETLFNIKASNPWSITSMHLSLAASV